MKVLDIEIIERDNNIPPEKSVLAKNEAVEEDFDTFKQNIRAQLDRLESRIAKIEKGGSRC